MFEGQVAGKSVHEIAEDLSSAERMAVDWGSDSRLRARTRWLVRKACADVEPGRFGADASLRWTIDLRAGSLSRRRGRAKEAVGFGGAIRDEPDPGIGTRASTDRRHRYAVTRYTRCY